MTDRTPVRESAQGRWRNILPSFGLDRRALSGKHGPCPMCGGTDRFRFDDKEGRGTWFCSSCGAGDGVALVMAKAGLDFRDAAKKIEELVGSAPRIQTKPARPVTSKRDDMNRLWRSATPVSAGDPAALWLARRVGVVNFPTCLRTAYRTPYVDDVTSYHPCMVAMVMGFDGKPAQLHRTYLTKDGHKAPVQNVRRMMPGELPPGSAVRLFPPAEKMGVAEGIETAYAAASLFGIPVWAAINADNLAKWVAPPEAREIIIFGDNDPKFAGHAHAWRLAHRLACKDVPTRVEIPSMAGWDWNDVLLKSGSSEAAA